MGPLHFDRDRQTNPLDATPKSPVKRADRTMNTTSVYLCLDSNAIEVHLCNEQSHGEHIKKEGADIVLYRSRETGKATGCRLPTYLPGITVSAGDSQFTYNPDRKFGPDGLTFSEFATMSLFHSQAFRLINTMVERWDSLDAKAVLAKELEKLVSEAAVREPEFFRPEEEQ